MILRLSCSISFERYIYFQVKINGSNDEMLRAAAEQFGDKTVDEVMFSKFPQMLNSLEIRY